MRKVYWFAIILLWPQWVNAIRIDGNFDDWNNIPSTYIDNFGDGHAEGADIRSISITNDDSFLYLRLSFFENIDLFDDEELTLYIDGDNNTETSLTESPLGAECKFTFKVKFWIKDFNAGTYADPIDGEISFTHEPIGLNVAPTIASKNFELRINRDAQIGSNLVPIFSNSKIGIALQDNNGDRAPERNQLLHYQFASNGSPNRNPVDLNRLNPAHLRIISLNVNSKLWDPEKQAPFERLFTALAPDIINVQEMYDNSSRNIEDALEIIETLLPSKPSQQWYGVSTSDCKTFSRFPILDSWQIGKAKDNNTISHIDATGSTFKSQMLLVNTHLYCCNDDAGRQEEVDEIIAFIRDSKIPNDIFTLPENSPIIITGDMNFVGKSEQRITLLTGDILDNETFGPDHLPDWDASQLREIPFLQTGDNLANTWGEDRNSAFPPGQLDYFLYSDSILEAPNYFIVNTMKMNNEELTTSGLLQEDSLVTDHLILCVDLATSNSDTDGNQLRDVWEKVHFGAIGIQTAENDWDSDGQNNLAEMRAGTNPKEQSSKLQLHLETRNANTLQLSWKSIQNKRYHIEYSIDLTHWASLSNMRIGDGTTFDETINLNSTTKASYYRLVVGE